MMSLIEIYSVARQFLLRSSTTAAKKWILIKNIVKPMTKHLESFSLSFLLCKFSIICQNNATLRLAVNGKSVFSPSPSRMEMASRIVSINWMKREQQQQEEAAHKRSSESLISILKQKSH
jgi:hypothetical protein